MWILIGALLGGIALLLAIAAVLAFSQRPGREREK
jgi:hypothetical protein